MSNDGPENGTRHRLLRQDEHGGNVHEFLHGNKGDSCTFIDFSANINPLGPPAWLRSQINRDLEMVVHYPDPDCSELGRVIAERYNVAPELVIAANGTTELLHLLPHILERRRVVIPVPSYIDYRHVFEKNGFDVCLIPLEEADGFAVTESILDRHLQDDDIVLFGNPSNPSGACLSDNDVIEVARAHPSTLFIVDEAFHDFVAPGVTVGGRDDNIITLNSLTKFFAIPGLRIGFGIFPARFAALMRSAKPQWSVNTLAAGVACRAIADEEYCRASLVYLESLRQKLQEGLESTGSLKVYPSSGNYLLIRLLNGMNSQDVYEKLLEERIIVRRCSNYQGLDHQYIRIAVRDERQNRQLIAALQKILGKPGKVAHKTVRQARTLMFQGTSSNAGKSVLAAAFCRILLQDGVRVAPFKAQNMSLNSHVTRDGGEMGRAQVVQAMAARVDPDWRMNPVLLKPNSSTGSQVIINGKPVGNMDIRQYHAYKEKAWEAAVDGFSSLAGNFEAIILEGAGSPGEVNLKRHDFVNMKMARYAEAPVLLVGDIDRGGVYASFAGIMDVLEEWERRLIAGFVVNKFRGDQTLLDEAHTFIADHTGREVFGVVPYILNMRVPQEDSVALKEGHYTRKSTESDQVEIAVIELPHIANYNDIDPLYHEPDVNIRFVATSDVFGHPDAVIIPGSKNVADDIRFLREAGLDLALTEYAAAGGVVVGICGGYQMLGRTMKDPHRLETDLGAVEGFGLLNVDTVLAAEKTLRRQAGTHVDSGLPVRGYEIHHGVTEGQRRPVIDFGNGATCGSRDASGRIWGAYLHGIFDEDRFRRWFIDQLRVSKGLQPRGSVLMPYDIDKELDSLADCVRSCFDMNRVYRLMGL